MSRAESYFRYFDLSPKIKLRHINYYKVRRFIKGYYSNISISKDCELYKNSYKKRIYLIYDKNR